MGHVQRDGIQFLYTLKQGATASFGIHCARLAQLPSQITHTAETVAQRQARAEAALAEAQADAERWIALCNLWMASTILTLTQDEDGRWSIGQTEPVDSETFATLTGDTPDAAIDAARSGGKG